MLCATVFLRALIESSVITLHKYFLNDKNRFPYDLKSVYMYLILGNLVIVTNKTAIVCGSKT